MAFQIKLYFPHIKFIIKSSLLREKFAWIKEKVLNTSNQIFRWSKKLFLVSYFKTKKFLWIKKYFTERIQYYISLWVIFFLSD